MGKIVVIGGNGQLGVDLVRQLRELTGAPRGPEVRSTAMEVVSLTHGDLEICDHRATREMLQNLGPEVVINTAAFHRVDDCEENLDKAFVVNTAAVGNLALLCREMEAVLVHLSTDYVFGGEKGRATPYLEKDHPWPMNVYGASKLAGEHLVRSLCPKHFVVRTCGLYGVAGSSGKGGNFIETMLKLGREGKSIRVVNDQRLSPTSTATLAKQIIRLLQTDRHGLYHATSQGHCSWFEFAREIFRLSGLSPDLSPQSTAQSGARATRPSFSVLENQALKALELDIMPPWQVDLEHYLKVRSCP